MNDNSKERKTPAPSKRADGDPGGETAAARLKAALAGTRVSELPAFTVAGADKIGLSMWGLAHGMQYFASTRKDRDFSTLDEVDEMVREWEARRRPRRDRDKLPDNVCTNITDESDLVVLDVEPTASRRVKDYVAGCAEAVYVERSVSGEGLHAWIPRELVDELLLEYPDAAGKPVWRMPVGDEGCPYELLLRHQAVSTGVRVEADPTGSIVPLLRDLASRQIKAVPRMGCDRVDAGDVPGGTAIAEIVARQMAGWGPSQTGLSERDCAVASMAARHLERMRTDLSADEMVAVVELAAQLWLEAHGELRDKWAERHYADGSTYGRGTAASAVSLVCGDPSPTRPWRYAIPDDPDELDATAAVMAVVSLGAGAAAEFSGDVAEDCGVDPGDLSEDAIKRAEPSPEPMGRRGGRAVAKAVVESAISIGRTPPGQASPRRRRRSRPRARPPP